MAKFEKPSLWLGTPVNHIVSVDGENGEKKDFSFRLLLNFNALRVIEKYTGIPLSNPLAFFPACKLLTNQAIMFWAACRAYHPELQDDDGLDFIGSLLNYKNAAAANDAVYAAFLKSLPEDLAAKVKKLTDEAKERAEKGETQDPPSPAPAGTN
jgi:hypothetical protein